MNVAAADPSETRQSAGPRRFHHAPRPTPLERPSAPSRHSPHRCRARHRSGLLTAELAVTDLRAHNGKGATERVFFGLQSWMAPPNQPPRRRRPLRRRSERTSKGAATDQVAHRQIPSPTASLGESPIPHPRCRPAPRADRLVQQLLELLGRRDSQRTRGRRIAIATERVQSVDEQRRRT